MEQNNTTSQSTKIDPDDSPSGNRLDGTESYKRYYKRLSNANSPEWDGPRRDENITTERDHKNLLDSVASSLELTPHQKSRAELVLDQIDPRHFRGNKNVAVILSICGHVGREDGRAYHPAYIGIDAENIDVDSTRSFVTFADGADLTMRDMAGCWERVGDEV